MIHKRVLTNVQSVLKILSEQPEDLATNRYRSSYLYRGLPNKKFKLVTSLERNCKKKKDKLERNILRNFSKYAQLIDPSIQSSTWRQIILGQHHGLPTRLLDWTYSPLGALHFALGDEDLENLDKEDGAIWKIDVGEINKLCPEKYQDKLKEEDAWLFTVEMLAQITADDLSVYDTDMNESCFVMLEPPSIDQRIINQYSIFSVMPKGITNIEDFLSRSTNNTIKYIIKKDIKWRIRDMLDQLNMNERTLLPDFDGLCKWLKRHYFVK